MSNPSILVKNGTLLTMNQADDIIDEGAVLIEEGVITKIGSSTDVEKGFGGKVIDARGNLVMPGLVNVHTHLPMSLFKGLSDDLPLMVWLNEYMFPAEARFINPDTVLLGTRLACAELLLSGTTCCCDGYFYEDQVAEAVLSSGIRGVLAQGIIDFPAPGVPDPSKNISHAVDYVKTWKGKSSCVRPSIFCHSPYTCSDKTLVNAKKAASDYGVLFQVHVAETQTERDQILSEKGMSPVAYLDSLGVLDEDTLLVHGVHVDERDLDIVAQRGAAFAHAPESNMKLASGVAPVLSYLDRGVRCGLGTDGSASNNNLDLFSEMDMAAKLHKVSQNDPTVMDARTVLAMATQGGASAIKMGGLIGSLETGKRADLIIVDTAKPHLTPMYNPFSHLVYSATGTDVSHVIVDGRLVVENRQLLTMDLQELIAGAREFGKTVMKTMM